jgi:alpha-1,3-glucosyltransferase
MLPPTAPLLPLALFTSSMAFFLFSFQVHEKSVLVPLLSILMLLGEKGEGDGTVWDGIVGLLNVATFRSVSNLRSVQV